MSKEIDKSKTYSIPEAAELISEVSTSKFVGSVDLVVNLNLKEKHANESIRGSIVFPNQFGESKKVLVLAEGEAVKEAEKAGADFVGLDKLIEKIEGGWLDFDVVIAQPAVMPKIAKLGKVLGPRQLMPNPKSGTVTENVSAAVSSYKAGKIDFKMGEDKSIKLKVAKLDMSAEQIEANVETALDAIKNEVKRLGQGLIGKSFIKPTMGPAIKIEA